MNGLYEAMQVMRKYRDEALKTAKRRRGTELDYMAEDYERDAQELNVAIKFLEKLSEALNA